MDKPSGQVYSLGFMGGNGKEDQLLSGLALLLASGGAGSGVESTMSICEMSAILYICLPFRVFCASMMLGRSTSLVEKVKPSNLKVPRRESN